MKRLVLICLLLTLIACAGRHEAPLEIPENCRELFVLLPENYIIDVEAGANVYLNPVNYEFIVFCSAEEAAKIREKGLRQGLLSDDAKWRIFKLEGVPAEYVKQCADSALCLDKSAKVTDWIPESLIK